MTAKPFDPKKFNVTPIGELQWVQIKTPDAEDNKYKCQIRLNEKDAKEFLARIHATIDAEGLTGNKVVYPELKPAKDPVRDEDGQIVKDEDGATEMEEVPGIYSFTFSRRASWTNDEGEVSHFHVGVVDAKNVPIAQKDIPNIANGTVGQISFTYRPYEYAPKGKVQKRGITFDMRGLRIIELKTWGTSNDYGFGDAVDGYNYSAVEKSEYFPEEGEEEDTPSPVKKAAPKKVVSKSSLDDDLSDSIPF